MSADDVICKICEEATRVGASEKPGDLVAFTMGFQTSTWDGTKVRSRRAESLARGHEGTLHPSQLEEALHAHRPEAERVVAKLVKQKSIPRSEKYIYRPEIDGCVFTGHTNTDMDSIASAIGCAYLYDGLAARSSDVNAETKFCLKRWGWDQPKKFEETDMLASASKRGVVLVDHNQRNQSPASFDPATLKGVIDHHAIQSRVVLTSAPIFTDIRPWGSCCSIVTHQYITQQVHIPKRIAGILLSGILSDTLNLQSPTTTVHDRKMVTILAHLAGVNGREEINALANEQFAAKSNAMLDMTSYEIYHGDAKKFTFKNEKIKDAVLYWGTCEFKGDRFMQALLRRKEEFQYEMRAFKKEKGLQFMFLSLVDIANMRTVVIVADEASRVLANKAFTKKKTWSYGDQSYKYDCVPIVSCTDGVMELPRGYVSRKKTFIPPVKGVIQDEKWVPAPVLLQPDQAYYARVIHNCNLAGCRPMRLRLKDVASRIMMANIFTNKRRKLCSAVNT